MAKLKPIQDLFFLFIKIDLFIFAGLGTFLGILKLNKEETILTLLAYKPFIYFLFIVMALSFFFAFIISYEMADESKNARKKLIKGLGFAQIGTHAILLGWLLSGLNIYLSANETYNSQENAANEIQNVIVESYSNKQKLPKTIDSLYKHDKRIPDILSHYEVDSVEYELYRKGEFVITTPGYDGILGTEDDYNFQTVIRNKPLR